MVLALDDAIEVHWRRFGAWLREQRDRAGMTSTEAAERAGITLTQWSRIENGASGTRRGTLPQIANAIGANLREAYERAGFVPPSFDHDSEPAGPDTLELQTGFDDLSPEAKAQVLSLIRLLRNSYGGRDPRNEE